jgi:hypothetical protein
VYNQPKLCPNASWNLNATTFADSSVIGNYPKSIFVDSSDTVITGNRDSRTILILHSSSANITATIPTNVSALNSIAVANDNTVWAQIPLCTGSFFHQWNINGTYTRTHSTPYMQRKSISILL